MYTKLVFISEENKPLQRPRYRQKDNIKVNVEDVVYECCELDICLLGQRQLTD
jgi:hypothetical protein